MVHKVDRPLLGILLLALAVRVWGIGWQLPWLLHPDEHYVAGALKMWATRDPNPHYFLNPTLLTYWLAALYVPLRGALHLSAALFGTPDASARVVGEYLVGRLNSAVLGTATVWTVYRLGSLILGRRAALLAGAFLAFDFLHVRNSHYGTNDVAATFLLSVSLIFSARLSQGPVRSAYLLAGLFGGLATATKYNMGLFLAPLVVAHGLAWHGRAFSPRALRLLLIAGLTSAIGFVATNPFAVLDWQAFLAGFELQYKFGAEPWAGQAPGPAPPLRYLEVVAQGMGYMQVLLVVLGIGAGLRGRRPAALVLMSFILVYVLFMGSKDLFFARFALPLLPPLCVLAALGGAVLVAQSASVTRRPALGSVPAIIVLLQPTILIVQHNLIIAREDTRVLASRWAMKHLAGKGAIAIYDQEWDGGMFTLPAPAGGWPVGGLETAAGLPRTGSPDVRAPEKSVTRFLVVSSFVQDAKRLRAVRMGLEWPDSLERWWENEVARGEMLASFAPGVDGGPVPYRNDDVYTPFWTLGVRARPGPTIRIYKLVSMKEQTGPQPHPGR